MSEQDRISVIVPVYKTEKYLRRCVNSILNQDYQDLEIILVDDGSPDRSGVLCDEIARENEKIKVIHKVNGGLSSARNAGLDAASGRYVCFVDSDDYIAKDYVSSMHELSVQYDADLVKVDYIEVDTNSYTGKLKKGSAVFYEGEQVEKTYLELRVDSACVFLYQKELIADTRFPVGKTSEDIPFNFQIFRKAQRFVYLPEGKYFYYHNPESISNGPLDKNYMNYLLFRKEIYDYYQANGDKSIIAASETLYARAAMGMKARMAFYGVTSDVDEKEYKGKLDRVFKAHSKAFFADKHTPISRKVLALLVFYFYPVAKMMGRFIK